MTRIVAGTLGGRRLRTPPGPVTRPTAQRVREALFSSLGDVLDRRVLDLYAGSGALGFEALSRGAAHVTFVERAAPALRVLRRNAITLGLAPPVVDIVALDAMAFLSHRANRPGFDLVLADPPYADDVSAVLTGIGAWLDPGGAFVLERNVRSPEPVWPDGLMFDKRRTYGDTALWYFRSP